MSRRHFNQPGASSATNTEQTNQNAKEAISQNSFTDLIMRQTSQISELQKNNETLTDLVMRQTSEITECTKDNQKLQAELDETRGKLSCSHEAYRNSITQCLHYQKVITQLVKDCDALRKHIEDLERTSPQTEPVRSLPSTATAQSVFGNQPPPPTSPSLQSNNGSFHSFGRLEPDLKSSQQQSHYSASETAFHLPFGSLEKPIFGSVPDVNTATSTPSNGAEKPAFSFRLPATTRQEDVANISASSSYLNQNSEPSAKKAKLVSPGANQVSQTATSNWPILQSKDNSNHRRSSVSNNVVYNQTTISSSKHSATESHRPFLLKEPIISNSPVVGPVSKYATSSLDHSAANRRTLNTDHSHVMKLFDSQEDHKIVSEAYNKYIQGFTVALNVEETVETTEAMINWLANRGKLWTSAITDVYRVKFLLFELIRLVVATNRNFTKLDDVELDSARRYAQSILARVEDRMHHADK